MRERGENKTAWEKERKTMASFAHGIYKENCSLVVLNQPYNKMNKCNNSSWYWLYFDLIKVLTLFYTLGILNQRTEKHFKSLYCLQGSNNLATKYETNQVYVKLSMSCPCCFHFKSIFLISFSIFPCSPICTHISFMY